jgi:hypothetical protein
MACSKVKLKSSDDKVSPCFRQFGLGKISDIHLSIQTSLYVPFKHISINVTSYTGTPSSIRILFN